MRPYLVSGPRGRRSLSRQNTRLERASLLTGLLEQHGPMYPRTLSALARRSVPALRSWLESSKRPDVAVGCLLSSPEGRRFATPYYMPGGRRKWLANRVLILDPGSGR